MNCSSIIPVKLGISNFSIASQLCKLACPAAKLQLLKGVLFQKSALYWPWHTQIESGYCSHDLATVASLLAAVVHRHVYCPLPLNKTPAARSY